MAQQLYRTKNKFKTDKKFAAGYGAVKFVTVENNSMAQMVVMRPLANGGELAEFGKEAIPADMLPKLQAKMAPYAA